MDSPRRQRRGLHPQGHQGRSASSRWAAAPCCCSRLFPPAWLVGTAGLSVAKILENMEIGHNVMHGQWDWMRDPKIHSTAWEWDNAAPVEHVEALPQRAAPHVHQRPRPRQRPRLRHHAGRRGPALGAVLPRPAAVELPQRAASSSTASPPTTSSSASTSRAARTRTAVPRRRARRCWRKIERPGHQGLPRAPAAVRPVRSSHTMAANAVANLVRNLWTHSVIMCGHFPEGVETFDQGLHRRRDPRRVVPAPDARLGQHQRQQGHARHDRQPVAPDRAPPVPGPAEQPLRRDRARRSRTSASATA